MVIIHNKEKKEKTDKNLKSPDRTVVTRYGFEKPIWAVTPEDLYDEDEMVPQDEGEIIKEHVRIIESYSKKDKKILQKVKNKEFEKANILKLKLKSFERSKKPKLDKLISYPLIKDNLEYLPHQQEGAIKILRDMDCRALLADEVGLGKTITAGMVLKELIFRKLAKRILILTPPSLMNQWKEELKSKFNLNFKFVHNKSDWDKPKYFIASLDKVKCFNKKLKRFNHEKAHNIYWDLIIVDEAHKLKDRRTDRWKFVDRLQKKRLLLLTATPFQNDLLELYNLLYLLKRGHLGTLSKFKEKYLLQEDKRHPLNPEELKDKLDEVMIRRKRDETRVKYNKRIAKVIEVNLTDEEYQIYEKIIELLMKRYLNWKEEKIDTKMAIYSILPKITSSSKSSIQSLKRIVNDPKYHLSTKNFAKEILKDYKKIKISSKISILMKVVDKILSKDKHAKIMIYTKHPATLKYIVSKLEPGKLPLIEFFGGLNPGEKDKRIKKFKDKAQILISTDTGSEGLNLQFCNNIINYDLPWNPMRVEQRIGRLDRIGQKKNINVYALATKNTIEEYIIDLIIKKMCCIGLVMGELPVILINMGLDSKGKSGSSKIQERFMNAFIESKDNLEKFAKKIDEVEDQINKGIEEYQITNKLNSDLLD